MDSFENMRALAHWMIEQIGKHKEVALDPVRGADWDWVAAETWRAYPGVFNEYIINDAIDFLLESAEL